jgi:cullin 1
MHGTCVVSSKFNNDKTYDLKLTTYQTSIIVLFNDEESLNVAQIKDLIKTDDAVIKNMLGSLTFKKYKILSKTGEPKAINKDDLFSINEGFKSKLKQISIPAPVIKETFNREKVDIDRSHAIEAAIVKIMKSRKKMTYMNLSQEVMVVLQMFKPTASIIKSKIEGLIDRDYLERDPNDNHILRYKA